MPGRSTKEGALTRIAAFEAVGAQGVFKKISRQAVGNGLRVRVNDPFRIDQDTSSLCGAASVLFTEAKDDPVAYVNLVAALYDTGRGKLGKREIKPGSDLKEYQPPSSIDPADWIPMASIRDSENWFFDYESVKNEFAGITTPSEMKKWLKGVGYREVVDEAIMVRDDPLDYLRLYASLHSLQNLRSAAQSNDSDAWWVFLFVNAQVLYESSNHDRSFFPNHWIVLLSSTITDDDVQLEVYSWGKKIRVPASGSMSTKHFLRNYYGHVKCRY